MKIAIATRFFEKNPKKIKSSQKKLAEFLNNASNCNPQTTLVAVNTEADKANAIKFTNTLNLKNVHAFPVVPWGKFVPALNALVAKANELNADYILFSSLEIALNPPIIKQLVKHIDKETLVVGASLDGHDFKNGKNIGNGKTVPWNTLAIWNMNYLKINGFPMIGDALFSLRHAGVEELATIATYQQSFPFLKAKLVQIPNIEWKTDNLTGDRLKKHLKKMATKIKRPAKQLKKLNIKPPKITHIS